MPDEEVIESVPDDLFVSMVAASDDAGWLVGNRGDTGELWRLEPGEARVVAELDQGGMDIEASAEGLSGLVTNCLDDDDDCLQGWTAELFQFDSSGALEETTVLFETDEPRTSGQGANLVGQAQGATWAVVAGQLIEVNNSDEVIDHGPAIHGVLCTLDDGLYSVGIPELLFPEESNNTDLAGPDVIESSHDQPAGESELQILRYTNGSWSPLRDGSRRFPVEGGVSASCMHDRIEARKSGSDTLLGSWDLTTGWQEIPETTLNEMEALGLDSHSIGGRGAVVIPPDTDYVYERRSDGTYEPTSLDLPDLSEEGYMAPLLKTATSQQLLVACISTSDPDQDDVTACDVVEREEAGR